MRKRKTVAINSVDNNLSKDKEEYLTKIYTDPSKPGSFSGPEKLLEVVKKEGLHKISRDEIKTFLEKQDTYTVNRFVRRKFRRSRVIAYGINDLVDADLADFSRLSKFNDNVKFLLVAIDVFSRFAKVLPLKDKTAVSVLSAFESVYGSSPFPRKLRTDLGLEFKNKKVTDFLQKKGIKHCYASPPIKAGYAERFIQTLKQLIFRYLHHNSSFRYIDVLDRIVDNYNRRPHRSLGTFAPKEVNEKNQVSIWNDLYINSLRPKEAKKRQSTKTAAAKRSTTDSKKARPASRYSFNKGELVRISYAKSPFERSYKERFTQEAFVVTSRYLLDNIPVYKLADMQNTPVDGVFYGPDLQRIIKSSSDFWQIERVLKTIGKGKKQKVLVRWKGYGPKFDSYVLKSSLKNIS